MGTISNTARKTTKGSSRTTSVTLVATINLKWTDRNKLKKKISPLLTRFSELTYFLLDNQHRITVWIEFVSFFNRSSYALSLNHARKMQKPSLIKWFSCMEICDHTGRYRELKEEENEFVCPTIVFSVACEETELSTARIDVVPTYRYAFFISHH
jgi:hypothetical protein